MNAKTKEQRALKLYQNVTGEKVAEVELISETVTLANNELDERLLCGVPSNAFPRLVRVDFFALQGERGTVYFIHDEHYQKILHEGVIKA
ncbi:hypothetical protein SAMN02745116_00532 [Pilibacter termitis]|uniref:Uncharacterized protein n=1 Tax=Pilibacter termitis TaxID=263852 RepID=A0A1T4L432_9ENTE|nr:hypothetical protein [Pilibacter termitis]SJZ49476.1 hypothetical protein SAMN02745116_00532 [Pilibacter termitis]